MMNQQPNSYHCFVCGVHNPQGLQMRFYDRGVGEVFAEMVVPAHFQGYPGVVHGGVVAAMLDEVAGRSQMQGDPQRFMYTAQLNIRYRKPVPTDKLIRLFGHAGKTNGRVAFASGEIQDEEGHLLATADLVLVEVPASDLEGMDKEVLGWKVYPEEEG